MDRTCRGLHWPEAVGHLGPRHPIWIELYENPAAAGKPRIDCLRAVLAQLDSTAGSDAHSVLEGPLSPELLGGMSDRERLALRSWVWSLIATERRLKDPGLIRQELETALRLGQEADDDQCIYRALHQLGVNHYFCDEFAEAEACFQRSMLHARARWPNNLDETLHWPASTYARQAGKGEAAVEMETWRSRLMPASLAPRIQRATYLLGLGRKDQLIREASIDPKESCEAAAQVFAARMGLGREKRARAAAEIGLALAEVNGEREWEVEFRRFLEQKRGPVKIRDRWCR